MGRARRCSIGFAAGALLLAGCSAEAPAGGEADQQPASPDASTSATAGEQAGLEVPADALLPNVRSLRAFDLRVQGDGTRRLLRFSAALANAGTGPLVVIPRGRRSCRADQIFTAQRIHLDADDDSRFARATDKRSFLRGAGCMLDHPTHDHWHFDAMAAYSLRLPGETRPITARRKVSFCLRDNRRLAGVPSSVRREYYGECSATTRQGISPGWSDIYAYDLDGQTLRLPGRVDDGRLLCLDLRADPRRRIIEIDETDNASSIGLRIRGDQVNRIVTSSCLPDAAS